MSTETPINWNVVYHVIIEPLTLNPKISSEATRICGLIKGFINPKTGSPFVRISQDRIHRITGVHPREQAKATAILEEYFILKVHRNSKTRHIKYYEFFDINAHLLFIAPKWYEEQMEKEKMKSITCSHPLFGVFDKGAMQFIAQDFNFQEDFCIEKIKERVQEFEASDDFTSKAIYSSVPENFLGLKRTTIDKNILKTQNVLQSVGSDAQEKPVLKRRTKIPEKQNLRDHLKNVPLSQPTVNNPRRSVVDNYYNSRPFFQVMKLWNSLPSLKKISELKDKQNKTLDNSVLAVKALLSGSLLEKGMTDIDGRKQFVTFPQSFDKGTEKIDLHWLLEKIQTLHDIIMDPQAAPANKTPLTQMTLFDFILGKFVKQERYTSVLFQYCCGQRKTVVVDENPLMTAKMIEHYKDYVSKKELTAKDIQILSSVAARLINYRLDSEHWKKNNLTKEDIKSKNMENMAVKFYYSIEVQWGNKIRTLGPQYFASDHAWNIYLENVSY